MPKHYGIGVNSQSGDVSLDGTKTAVVEFDAAFGHRPSIVVALEDSGAAHVPYKTNVSTTGFKIRFKTAFTGVVSWEAKER